ncbi:glucose PTS transporter subunit IIA [Oryzibacter oryziterrae]|uniref:glucose PTS transporter subunit IIA n=1 Tax=Oryzibacter oryziterrae TaxID=2766474 RepID=UPI001F00533E|nr:glucose PTS transporter subunit IIA [Oryzibacter oryziterrae]
MDHTSTARQIVDGVGGVANIAEIDHCMTRLRLTLTDIAKADAQRIQAIPGVLGTLARGGQFQIVLGPVVAPVSAEVKTLVEGSKVAAAPVAPSAPAADAAGRFDRLAAAIIDGIGGPGNVKALEHCSTRLRFSLVDPSKTKVDKLKGTKGILGVVTAAQTQVIIGNEVVEVFRAIQRAFPKLGTGFTGGAAKKTGVGATLIDFVIGVFQPLVPAIAGAGMLKAMLTLLSFAGWVDPASDTYQVLMAVPNGVFFFLGFMVAVTTANKLNVDRIVAIAAVAPLLLPALATLVGKGITVFGMPIANVSYNAQVFPSILTVVFLSLNWRFWTRYVPKVVRIFAVPMLSLLVTVPVSLTILGPAGFTVGTYLTTAVLWTHEHIGWAATAGMAMALPFLVALGMHKPFLPYVVSQLGAGKPDPFYNAAHLAHNIAEAGAAFGVAIRTKNPEIRATGFSVGTSALFGITEPALYGLTLQNKRVLWSVLGGALAAGTYLGLTQVTGHVAAGPGLATMAVFMAPDNPSNIVNAFVGMGVAFVVSLALSLALWRDPVTEGEFDAVEPEAVTAGAPLVAAPARVAGAPIQDLAAPMTGLVIPLSDVADAAFSARMLGDGIAIRPQDGHVQSPANGVVSAIAGHAVTLMTDDGVELLIHVGIDTVNAQPGLFRSHVKVGDKVKVGQLLLEADLVGIAKAGFDTTTPVIVRNSASYTLQAVAKSAVAAGERLLQVGQLQPATA